MFVVNHCYFNYSDSCGFVGVRLDSVSSDKVSGFVVWFGYGYHYYFEASLQENETGVFFALSVPWREFLSKRVFRPCYEITSDTFRQMKRDYKEAFSLR